MTFLVRPFLNVIVDSDVDMAPKQLDKLWELWWKDFP